MKWADVDLENGWWSIPGAVAKHGQPHRVPLTKTVADILKARLKAAGEGAIFVFENPSWCRFGDPPRQESRVDSVQVANLRVPGAGPTPNGRDTHGGGRCAPRPHCVLNHVEGGPAATRVYDRYDYDAEKRDALDRWARRLAAILESMTKKVVAIRA